MDNDGTRALINEIDADIADAHIPASEQNQSLIVDKGGNGWQCTFACKEFVYEIEKAGISAIQSKHQPPSNFLRLDTTKQLIDEIDRSSDVRNAIEIKQGGNAQGTYVVKEMVYVYAMMAELT